MDAPTICTQHMNLMKTILGSIFEGGARCRSNDCIFTKATFSSDVWSEILRHLDTLEQTILWNTGSQLIRAKLGSQGGWKVLKFKSIPFLKKWPRSLLSRLSGLTVLVISAYEHNSLLPLLRPTPDDLIQLPKTLFKLKLDFVEVLRDEHLPLLPKSLYHLSLPYNRSISELGMPLLPSGLGILNLKNNLRICNPAVLPRQLVSYKGSVSAISPSSTLSDVLPPTLTSLRLEKQEHRSNWKMEDLSVLSSHPNLRYLLIGDICHDTIPKLPIDFSPLLETLIIRNALFPQNSIDRLPRELQRLELIMTDRFGWDWTNDSIFKLPRSLKHFVFVCSPATGSLPTFNLTPKCFEYLPPCLETFHIRPLVNLYQRDHLEDFIHLLPHSLTDLKLYFNVPSRSLSAIPPNVVRFGDYTSYILDPAIFLPVEYSFPRPVTKGPSYIPCGFVTDPYPHPDPEESKLARAKLPKKLESLTIGDFRPSQLRGAPFISLAKAESYEPFQRICIPEWMDSLKELNIDTPLGSRSEAFSHLPHRLTTLHMAISLIQPLEDSHFLNLPNTLTNLSIRVSNPAQRRNRFGFTDECIWALPHDLVTLKFSGLLGIRFDQYPLPKRIQTLTLDENSPFASEPYRPIFPFWTTHLSLLSSRLSAYTFKSGLPTFLTTLVLNPDIHLDAQSLLPFLPLTLTHLYAPKLDLTDEDVQDLPTSLRTLTCPNASRTLSQASASLWPPLLRSLTIKGTLYTEDAVKVLPRTIISLDLNDARLISQPESLGRFLSKKIEGWTICNTYYPN